MVENLPIWINLMFLATWLIAIIFFYFSNNKPKLLTLLIVMWSILQAVLGYIGFYNETLSSPPRFALVLLPTIFLILFSLRPKQRTWITSNRNIKLSTFLHTIRLPIEIILLQLFIHKMIPELMTFEGRNFDIIAGLTAPIIGLLYLKDKISRKILVAWNVMGLLLVTFILINGILSAELPIQQFAFEQPNRAILYFPFILLPAVIVPIVIWTHITDIVKLQTEIKVEI